ncbi:MAG: hypothetical protein DSY76_02900 [Bacteroidetes bacterium]|nr:MAG: hypothetical protein DSY76_02900 [Bacteroidota bacterium]
MAKISNKEDFSGHMLSIFVPEEILSHFELETILENEKEMLFSMVEKQDQYPEALQGKEVVQDGFMNSSIIQSFPTKGKQCYIGLKRRRWKEKGNRKSYQNSYTFTSKGTMVTKEFGAFLKRNSLTVTPCSIVL